MPKYEDYTEFSKNKATVRVYSNGILIASKYFRNKVDRANYMTEMRIILAGVKCIFFEVAFQYQIRKNRNEWRRNRRKLIKLNNHAIQRTVTNSSV